MLFWTNPQKTNPQRCPPLEIEYRDSCHQLVQTSQTFTAMFYIMFTTVDNFFVESQTNLTKFYDVFVKYLIFVAECFLVEINLLS